MCANPQPYDNHLRLANSIFEAILFRKFSQNQLNIIYFILRLSYACNKKFAIIKNKNKFELVGVHKNYINDELEYLQKNKVLIIYPDLNVYALNKNFDEWKIALKKRTDKKVFNELLSENINMNKQFIDSINNSFVKSTKDLSDQQKIVTGSTENSVFLHPENPDNDCDTSSSITSINNNYYNTSNEQEELLNILTNVENYPFDVDKDAKMLEKFMRSYPDIDLIEALNAWSVYKLNNPLTNKCNPRSQLNTWIKKGVEFGKYQKQVTVLEDSENSKVTRKIIEFESPEETLRRLQEL